MFNDDPQLQLSGGPMAGPSDDELQRLIMEATMRFRQVDPSSLQPGDSQTQYEMARKFLLAAHENFQSNPFLAGRMADKANTMFGVLAPKPQGVDAGLVGLLRPLLGHRSR